LNKSEINKINRVQLGRIRARPRHTVRVAHARGVGSAHVHGPWPRGRGLRSLGRPRPAHRARPACERVARTARSARGMRACTWRLCPAVRMGDDRAAAHRRGDGGATARAMSEGDATDCCPSDAARTAAVGTAAVGAAARGARRSGNGRARRGTRSTSGGREVTVGAVRSGATKARRAVGTRSARSRQRIKAAMPTRCGAASRQ
jgi:hypothetical protein